MKHTIVVKKNQKDSRVNPGVKINHWIDYFTIDDDNESVEVTLNDLESYKLLVTRFENHSLMCEIEDLLLDFTIKNDKDKLQLTFKSNIKETLEFLKGLKAFTDEAYDSALSYLKNNIVTEDESNKLKIPSTTIQSGHSNSCRLFSADRTSTTPPTPPSPKNYSI